MNLNHLEAIALTQKIAYSLPSEIIGAVEVAVLPPSERGGGGFGHSGV
jgi:triosephosphate isomerase